jgi:hypothetical protein
VRIGVEGLGREAHVICVVGFYVDLDMKEKGRQAAGLGMVNL